MKLTFKEYCLLSESTKDVYSAIGKTRGDKLLSTAVDPKVAELHDKTFGKDNHHVEIPLSNPVPQKVIDHVYNQGDTMDGEHVKLKSGRHVELSKYLPRAKADKSTMDDHENWSRNKGKSNTKLVISRHPGEVASASTNTHWDSCANLAHANAGAPAKKAMPHEIKHGTLIAIHVHADAKPNEHGEYDSKDVLGRALIKRHDSPEGNISYHREERKYGAFPHVASEAVDHFTDHHYPNKDIVTTKHKDLYNDDDKSIKINKNASHDVLDNALKDKNPNTRLAALRHPGLTKEQIEQTLNSADHTDRAAAVSHPNATKEHINKALNDDHNFVRSAAVSHPNATKEHIDKALNDDNMGVRRSAITKSTVTKEHIDKALNDKSDAIRSYAVSNKNATKEHIDKALGDESGNVKASAVSHPNATKEHIDKALGDHSTSVRLAAISNPNATKEHIDKALGDESMVVRKVAAGHKNATKEHIDKALDDSETIVRTTAISHPNATKEHIDKALKDSDKDVVKLAKRHPNNKGKK